MVRIYLAYFLSGFVSLVYQIVWYRYFVDKLGASNITFVLVLCSFIGGIGVGAGVSRRAAMVLRPRLGGKDYLSFYGQIELIITIAALGTFLLSPFPNSVVGEFPYVLKGGVYEPTLTYQVCKGLAVVLCVGVPCFFMGVTFPLLCYTFRKREEFPSRLYAWNTAGACAGATTVFLPGLYVELLLACGLLRAFALLFPGSV